MVLLLLVLSLTAVASSKSFTEGQWDNVGEALASEFVGFYVALRHNKTGLAAFNKRFEEVSSPDSASYGKWFKPSEVLDLIAPPAHESARVMEWLRGSCPASSFRKLENRRDTVRVEATAHCVRRIFPATRLAHYRHSTRRALAVRLHAQSRPAKAPAHLAHVVDFVIGLDMLPVVRKRKTRKASTLAKAPAGTSYDFVYAGDINRVYNIPSNVISPGSKSTQSVVEFYPEGAPLWEDLQLFNHWSNTPFTNFSTIVGPFSVGNNGESLLDIQLISAVAWTPTVYITIPDGWAFAMASELFSMVNPPLVNSVSYGWPELLTCQSGITNAHCDANGDAAKYVARAEIEIQKATSLGLSFSICSQDEGAPSEQNMQCSLDSTQPVWSVYPGCSAFATSVSATTLITNSAPKASAAAATQALPPICNRGYTCSTGSTELPCTVANTYYQWTTGGGFSSYIERPSWQAAAVGAYLNSGVTFPPTGTFNSSNRAYPDVAAFGSRILVVSGGQVSVSAGTSASTPIVAGIMTLINEARFKVGKSSIGFWNPALYRMYAQCPKCFNRIASGDNRCTEGVCCQYGYYVAPGTTNAVTGLGSLNVAEIIKYMTQL